MSSTSAVQRWFATYRRLLRGSMRLLGVNDCIQRKLLMAVVIQYVSAMSLLLLPIVFLGPRESLVRFPTEQLVATVAIVFLATLAFANTVWIVRRDVLDPVLEVCEVTTALADGRLDASPTEPSHQDEIATLQESVTAVHRYLQIVTAQTHALSREVFDAPILEEPIPGRLGESLETMQAELERRIRMRDEELEANERAFRRLYRVTSDPDLSFEAKLEGLLEIGRDRLSADYAYVTAIDIEAGTQEIVVARGDHDRLTPGDVVPLDRAYCRRTIDADEPTSFESPDEWPDDPAHEVFDFGSYIGQAIVVEDLPYGTCCFANDDPRTFSDLEETFVDLLALWVSYERERDQRIRNLRVLFDKSPDGIVVHDADGSIENVNQRMVDWLGYDRETLLSMDVADLDVEHDRDELRTLFAAIESADLGQLETTHRRANGSTYPAEVWVNTIETDTGTKHLSVVRDVSDRHDRDRQLHVMDRVLRHNLHNEMAIIRGYAQTIEGLGERAADDSTDDDVEVEATAAYASEIVRTCDQLLTTVDKQRDIVDLLSERPEPVEQDVVAIVEQLADRKRDRNPDARLEVDCPDRATVRAVPQLDHAIDELLENAFVHNDRDVKSVCVSVEGDEETVRLEVRDDGPGIPEMEVAILMGDEIDPLYHGSGLGLWLVHWIVKRSGGTIDFDENDPDGSVVTVEFPAATPIETASESTAETLESP